MYLYKTTKNVNICLKKHWNFLNTGKSLVWGQVLGLKNKWLCIDIKTAESVIFPFVLFTEHKKNSSNFGCGVVWIKLRDQYFPCSRQQSDYSW